MFCSVFATHIGKGANKSKLDVLYGGKKARLGGALEESLAPISTDVFPAWSAHGPETDKQGLIVS